MSSTTIDGVVAWEALDSRGTPTVACEIRLSGGAHASATVPSGASTGTHEATELRDGGERYGGRGVRQAVESVNGPIAAELAGMDAADQDALDAALRELDGTAGLSRLGANAVLAVSLAAALAAADAEGVPLWRRLGAKPLLPLPMVNVISGGAHARGPASTSRTSWSCRSERRASPRRSSGRGACGSAPRSSPLPGACRRRSWRTRAASGSRWLPTVPALELLLAGIERSGLDAGRRGGDRGRRGRDAAPRPDGYVLAAEDRTLDSAGVIDELEAWCRDFPVVSLEDPLSEDDWSGWTEVTQRLGSSVQLLGDDLFVTQVDRLERGVREGAANAVLVKPNQCGTLSGAQATVDRARAAGYATVVSARSGDTEDAWLADLAVGWRAGQIKVGSTTRSERTAKWNRLLRIEQELGPGAEFAGRAALAPLGT